MTETSSSPASSIPRRHDLDALRAIAMLLGILLHGMLSFVPMPDAGWPVHDVRQGTAYSVALSAIHGFRMPLFFLLSGFFTAMLWRRRGLSALVIHRIKRIFLPLVLGTITIVPLVWAVSIGTSVLAPSTPSHYAEAAFFDAVRSGDTDVIDSYLQAGNDPDAHSKIFGYTALSIAAAANQVAASERLIDAGAGVNARDRDGSTPLHAAAFFGRVEAVELLLASGADPGMRNRLGETPLALLDSSATRLIVVSTISENPIDPQVVMAGRRQIADRLRTGNQSMMSADPLVAGSPASTVATAEVITEVAESDSIEQTAAIGGLEGIILFLTFFPVFHHLWFLYYLCWLVAAFALYAMIAGKLSIKPPRWMIASPLCLLWLIPLTMIPQSMMGTIYPNFGPDTSAGILPVPQVLLYYAIFFFFGGWYFDANDTEGRLGRWWPISLPLVALVVFPIGYAMTTGEFAWTDGWLNAWWYRPLAIALQVLYVWLMSFALMGLFRRFCSGESRTMRYLSDSSYWLYLAHLPLIMVAQAMIRDWEFPGIFKLTLIVGVCSLILLATYQVCVRYTPIGTLLNGPRRRPGRIQPAAVVEPAAAEA